VTVLPVQPGSGLSSHELGHFPICLVGTSQSAWAHDPRPGLTTLHQQPVLLFSDDFSLTRRLRQAFDAEGVQPDVVVQSSQWDFLLSMAMAGMGTALLPQPLVDRLKLGDDVLVRPIEAPDLNWAVGLIWVPERYMSHAARAWLAVCREAL
jgi:DNA-binding transcriptional LysR family regulator